MVDVAPGINRDRAFIVLESNTVFTCSADDAPTCRLDIAQGYGIVCVLQTLFRMAQQLQGLFGISLLKDEPRLLHLYYGSQFIGPHGFGSMSRLNHMFKRLAVFTFFPMCSALPEIGQDDKV